MDLDVPFDIQDLPGLEEKVDPCDNNGGGLAEALESASSPRQHHDTVQSVSCTGAAVSSHPVDADANRASAEPSPDIGLQCQIKDENGQGGNVGVQERGTAAFDPASPSSNAPCPGHQIQPVWVRSHLTVPLATHHSFVLSTGILCPHLRTCNANGTE